MSSLLPESLQGQQLITHHKIKLHNFCFLFFLVFFLYLFAVEYNSSKLLPQILFWFLRLFFFPLSGKTQTQNWFSAFCHLNTNILLGNLSTLYFTVSPGRWVLTYLLNVNRAFLYSSLGSSCLFAPTWVLSTSPSSCPCSSVHLSRQFIMMVKRPLSPTTSPDS